MNRFSNVISPTMLQLPILGFYSSGIDVCKCTPLKLNPQSMIRPKVSIPLFPRCTLYMFSGFSGGVWLGCTRTARLTTQLSGHHRLLSFIIFAVLRTENTPSPRKIEQASRKTRWWQVKYFFSFTPTWGN